MLFACSLMMIFPFFHISCSLLAHTHRNKDAQIKNEKETRKLISEHFTRISTKKRKKMRYRERDWRESEGMKRKWNFRVLCPVHIHLGQPIHRRSKYHFHNFPEMSRNDIRRNWKIGHFLQIT